MRRAFANNSQEMMMSDEEYKAKLGRAKLLARRLLSDNDVSPKTKLAYKLIYSVFYGVFDGELPAGVSILLLAGRADELIKGD